jgi:hypothetical protein
MSPNLPDEDLKLNRRIFLQHSAFATATGAALVGISQKTDALLAQTPPMRMLLSGSDPLDNLYGYHNPE